jgi:hypothetical protein
MKLLSIRKPLLFTLSILSFFCAHPALSSPFTYRIDPVVVLKEEMGPTIKNRASAVWIADLKQLKEAWPEVDLNRTLPGSGRPISNFDFSTYGLLLVSFGKMHSAGHDLVLISKKSRLVDDIARVTVDWVKPDQERIKTEVETRPCLLIQLRKGIFNHIEVLDDKGGLKSRISL